MRWPQSHLPKQNPLAFEQAYRATAGSEAVTARGLLARRCANRDQPVPPKPPNALREKQPKLGELMAASRADVLAYMDFPREHWPQIASTNPLERVNREIKRRTEVIGIFPNDEAISRLVGSLMLEINDEWAVARRYMSLEALARVTNTANLRLLPAMAA